MDEPSTPPPPSVVGSSPIVIKSPSGGCDLTVNVAKPRFGLGYPPAPHHPPHCPLHRSFTLHRGMNANWLAFFYMGIFAIMSFVILNQEQFLVTYAGMEEDLNQSRRPSQRPSVASNWQNMTSRCSF